MTAKYADLLQDPDVDRWYENLSQVRSSGHCLPGGLGFYCKLNKTTPGALLDVASTKDFRDGFTDFVREIERREMVDRKSWMTHE